MASLRQYYFTISANLPVFGKRVTGFAVGLMRECAGKLFIWRRDDFRYTVIVLVKFFGSPTGMSEYGFHAWISGVAREKFDIRVVLC